LLKRDSIDLEVGEWKHFVFEDLLLKDLTILTTNCLKMTTEEPMQVTPEPEQPVVAAPDQEAPALEVAPAAVETAPIPAAAPVAETVLTEKTQKVISDEKEASNRAKADVQSLPTRQYLDQTVVPILLQALTALSKERPPDAIDFLVAYLMKNKTSFQQQSS